MRESTLKMRKHILHLCKDKVPNVASEAARHLNISKQAAARHLQSLEKAGLVKSTGRGKAKTSTLVPVLQFEWTFKREGLSEDQVWRENLSPHFKDLNENVRNLWHYGITEMLNNAIDHSQGSMVRIFLTGTALDSTVSIMDDGEGIFHRIQRLLALYDPREAILELVKGKLTTDVQNHTGEGIFFTSRAFDNFEIDSHHFRFAHKRDKTDWLIEEKNNLDVPGSTIILNLDHDCTRTLKSVFDEFAPPEEFDFSKTIVPLQLAKHEGEKLMSRSQAKRLVARFEKFKTVILDFTGVEDIGQGFADEIFRVFAKSHPRVELIPINVAKAVQTMISRVLQNLKPFINNAFWHMGHLIISVSIDQKQSINLIFPREVVEDFFFDHSSKDPAKAQQKVIHTIQTKDNLLSMLIQKALNDKKINEQLKRSEMGQFTVSHEDVNHDYRKN